MTVDTRTADVPRPGLRERKKAKTRALIQEVALRLFAEQGYEQTSIEQIADVADVSVSTIFRYFPTKPDLVIYDDLDERLMDVMRAQPADLGAVEALRAGMQAVFGNLARSELAVQLERAALMASVPELRAAMLDELVRTMTEIAALISERTGRRTDDDAVVALAGAVIGVSIGAWFGGGDKALERFPERVDAGMALLASGFRL